MILNLVSGPVAEPISRSQAKRHLREDGTDQDVLIDACIVSARQEVEGWIGRALVSQTHELRLYSFCDPVTLPLPPLIAVDSLKYIDGSGVERSLTEDVDYRLIREIGPRCGLSRIVPVYGGSWPATRNVFDAVTIRFRAGYVTPFIADAGGDHIQANSHPFVDGDIVRLQTTDGDLPAGLVEAADYYVRDVTGDSFALAASAGGGAIDIADAGTGTHFVGACPIPQPLISAMLLLIAGNYENREAQAVGVTLATNPAVTALLTPYRLWKF